MENNKNFQNYYHIPEFLMNNLNCHIYVTYICTTCCKALYTVEYIRASLGYALYQVCK